MKASVLLMLLAVYVLDGRARVLADDYATLEAGLEKSSIKVNDIHLPDLVYSIDEETATQHFQKYFTDHRYNDALRVNLGYAAFHWGNNHRTLQKALAGVFAEKLEEFFTGKDKDIIKRVMGGEKELHNHYFFMLSFLVEVLRSNEIDADEKAVIGQRLLDMLEASRLCEPRYQHLPTATYPIINLVKGQLLLTCFSYADRCGQLDNLKPLLNERGTRKALLDRYDLLIVDNAFFDETQLRAILAYLEAVPSHLHWPMAVTCYDKLKGEVVGGPPVSVHQFACATNRFNVFATRVGAVQENQFPGDYPKVSADGFMIVLAHEHNHGVDARYIQKDLVLKAYRQRLLEMAGTSRQNYLRSMFNDGFFKNSPQEFVASIANMYFGSSEDTLFYALQKAQAGSINQLNQFLLIASAYADDETCRFYRIGPNGRTVVAECPIRKTDGIITEITWRKRHLRFQLEDGIVTGISGP
jgi:hypothetical protein